MPLESANSDQLAQALAALRQEIAQLSARVAALESGAGFKPAARAPLPAGEGPGVRAPTPAPDAGLSEEILVVIGAAVAAFLGKKARIRQIHLVGTGSWSQQGRATIQASHLLGA